MRTELASLSTKESTIGKGIVAFVFFLDALLLPHLLSLLASCSACLRAQHQLPTTVFNSACNAQVRLPADDECNGHPDGRRDCLVLFARLVSQKTKPIKNLLFLSFLFFSFAGEKEMNTGRIIYIHPREVHALKYITSHCHARCHRRYAWTFESVVMPVFNCSDNNTGAAPFFTAAEAEAEEAGTTSSDSVKSREGTYPPPSCKNGNGLDLERPKVVQCGGPGNGGQFVMWVRGTGYGNSPQLLGVAVSDSPKGPFAYVSNKTGTDSPPLVSTRSAQQRTQQPPRTCIHGRCVHSN